MSTQEQIREHFIESITAKQNFLTQGNIARVQKAASWMSASIRGNKPVLFCGNGGSAADAQHLAAELVGKFLKDRRPLPAIALGTNFSSLSAIGNDYGFEDVFVRPLEALGKRGGVLVAISTSGNSKNVLKAVRKAKKMGMKIIAMTGRRGGALKRHADILFAVASDYTPTIQEAHITIGHVLCLLVDRKVKNK